ncbi:MAG: aminotransferase class IV [bacterium]
MNIRHLTRSQFFDALPAPNAEYLAMYSSACDGIVTDPSLMVVPADDHLVHRGDGVFETIKCIDGLIYCLTAHLDRLVFSAGNVGLVSPWSHDELADVIVQTIRAGGKRDCLVRILLSRGPGSLGVNPYDCPKPGLYVVVHKLKPSFMETHPGGARVITSKIPVKPGFFANIKSCNYLPNVLMKKEAADTGVDFSVSFDEKGFLGEGATENAGIVTRDGNLLVPTTDRILSGTTMFRAIDLARFLVDKGLLKSVGSSAISRDMIVSAAEVLIFGTTPDVTAVVEFDGKPIGSGRPGPVSLELNRLIINDIRTNKAVQSPVFPH